MLVIGNMYYVDVERHDTTRLKRMGLRIPSLFSHLADVDELLVSYVTNKYSSKGVLTQKCETDWCIEQFFKDNEKKLYYPCVDHRIFSHCQKHWLVVYNAEKHRVSSYHMEKCKISRTL